MISEQKQHDNTKHIKTAATSLLQIQKFGLLLH